MPKMFYEIDPQTDALKIKFHVYLHVAVKMKHNWTTYVLAIIEKNI